MSNYSFRFNARGKIPSFHPLIKGIILFSICFIFLYFSGGKTLVKALSPGLQEYFVLGNEYHIYRMLKSAGLNSQELPPLDGNQRYMSSIVDVTVSTDDQIIFYDHWEDGYETDITTPTQIKTLVLGDGNPTNGHAGDYTGRANDRLFAGDSLTFSSRYNILSTGAITGYVPINPRSSSEIRFDGGDRIVSTAGPIGLIHNMWPINMNDVDGPDQTWLGDSWEIYSTQALANAISYRIPIGEDMGVLEFSNVALQIQALEDNTNVQVTPGDGSPPIAFDLDAGQTFSSQGYINNDDMSATLNITITTGSLIQSSKPVQAGLVTYQHPSEDSFQDRYYNLLPNIIWGKEYVMPLPANLDPESSQFGHAEVYIYNPSSFTITLNTADKAQTNTFDLGPQAVVTYTQVTNHDIPHLSGIRLSSDYPFWAIASADANEARYDWGNTFIPETFLTDEYYASWAPGNVLEPPRQFACNTNGNLNNPPSAYCRNASPLWVTAVEDNTTVNVDYDNDGDVDDTFTLNALDVRLVRDNNDFDQSGTHIWTEAGQKIAVIWGEDPFEAGHNTPNLDVGHVVLPLFQGWLTPVMSFDKTASPEVISPNGGTVTFKLSASASFFSNMENVVVTDTLPFSWTYITNSTLITYPSGITNTIEPVISNNNNVQTLYWDLATTLNSDQVVTVQFQARIQAPNGIGSRRFDGFESNSYDGGSGIWLSDWIEAGGFDSEITISNTNPYNGDWHLSIANDNQTIYRTVDLNNFSVPTLRLKHLFTDLESNETFGIDISTDGGSVYNPLISWTAPITEDIWQQEEIDLSTYIAPEVQIRFRGISNVTDKNYWFLDDIEIYDRLAINTNQAKAKGVYQNYNYIASDQVNVYLTPFRLTKQVNRKLAPLGATLVYTLSYENITTSITGTNVFIQDPLPTGLNFVSASDGGQYIAASRVISWSIGSIGLNNTGQLTVTATVNQTVPPEDGNIIKNTATLLSDQTTSRSNTIEVVIQAANLNITKAGPGNVKPQGIITYTLQYQNQGSVSAINTIITDTIPTNTSYLANSCNGCITLAGNTILQWNLADIEPDGSGVLIFAVIVDNNTPLGYSIQNIAQYNHNTLSMPRDTNNVTTVVSNVTLSKIANKTLVGPNELIDFTLNYQNVANLSTETHLTITDKIPAGTTYVSGSATTNNGTTLAYSTNGGNTYITIEPADPTTITHLRWTKPTIAPAESGSQTFSVQVADSETLITNNTIINRGRLRTDQTQPVLSNEVVINVVNLTIEKLGPILVQPGDTFNYTLRLGNRGSAPANVILSDFLPSELNYVNATPSPVSTLSPITWSLTIPANSNNIDYTLTVSVPETIPLGTWLTNTTTLSSAYHNVADTFLTYMAGSTFELSPNRTKYSHQNKLVCYPHYVINSALISDTINLTTTNNIWSATNVNLYEDVDDNGTYQPSVDRALIDTNDDTLVDTGLIEKSEFLPILACLTIPKNVRDGSSNTTIVRGTSVTTNTNFSEVTDLTNVLVGPGLAFSKGGTPFNNNTLYAGEEIAYTLFITNVDAVVGGNYFTHTNLFITDMAPANLVFIPGSEIIQPAGGNITVTPATFTATYPGLGLNQSLKIIVRAQVLSTTSPGYITNVAYVDSEQEDILKSTSRQDVVEASIITQKLAEDLNGPPLVFSDTIRYTVLVTNIHPFTNYTNLTVDDPLPDLVTYVNGSASLWPPGSGSITYIAGEHTVSALITNLDSTETVSITFDVYLNLDSVGQSIVNAAVVSSTYQINPIWTNPICADGLPLPCHPIEDFNTIQLSKSATDVNGPPIIINDTIRYILHVTNTSILTADDIIVTDNLPAGVTFVQAATSQGSITNTSPIVWNVGDLSGKTTANLVITVTINADQGGLTITNTGSVTGTDILPPANPTPVCLDGSFEPCPPIVPATTLALSKGAADINGFPVTIGDIIHYTLQITNTGSYTAYNVILSDDLHDGLTYIDNTHDFGSTSGVDPIIWTIPQLPPATVATMILAVKINTDPQLAGEIITNTASVAGLNVFDPPPNPPPVCPDGSLEPCLPIRGLPHLVLTKTAQDVNGPPAAIGDTIVYSLWVSNTDQATATDVVVVDDLPNGITLMNTQTSAGSVTLGNITTGTINFTNILTWTIPTIPGFGSENLLITVTINLDQVGQIITNTGTVTAPESTIDPPPPPVCPDGNYEPCLPIVPTTTLALSKTAVDVDGYPVTTGDIIRYTVFVTNTGSYTAFNITLTDDLPDGVTYVEAMGSVGNAVGPDPVIWQIPQLATGASATLHITVTINLNQAGRIITNTASATAGNAPPPPSPAPICPDGSIEPCSPIEGPASVTLNKLAEDINGPPVMVSDTIRYQILVTNTSAITAYNLEVTDDLPNGVTYVAATVDNGSFTGPDPIIWSIGLLSGDAVASMFITVTINADQAGQSITNAGTITGPNIVITPPPPPPVCPDGTSEPCVGVMPIATLDFAKTAEDINGPPLVISDTIHYTLIVTNTSIYDAYDINVVDNLPTFFIYNVAIPSQGSAIESNGIITWTIPTLAPGNPMATLLITGTIAPEGLGESITNTASITALNVLDLPNNPTPVCPNGAPVNPNGLCDSFPLSDVFTTTLAISKGAADVNGPPLIVNDTIHYTIVVTNTGIYTAYNVMIEDALSPHLQYITGQTDQGVVSENNNLVMWNIPQLTPANPVATLQIDAIIIASGEGQSIPNSASATAPNVPVPPDPTPSVCPDGLPVNENGTCDNIPLPPYVCTPLDNYERDDLGTQGQPLTLFGNQLVSQQHSFHLPNDQDWIKLDVQPGASYIIKTSDLGSEINTRLTLYNDPYGLVTLAFNENDPANPPASKLTWTAPLSHGVVYLAASQSITQTPTCQVDYTLSIEQALDGELDPSQTEKTVEPALAALSVGDPVTYTITTANVGDGWLAPLTITDTLPISVSLESVEICDISSITIHNLPAIYLPIVLKSESNTGTRQEVTINNKPPIEIDTLRYMVYEYELVTATNSFTWVGAISSSTKISLCVYGHVALAPWDSTNTAWLSWNSQTITRTATGSSPYVPATSKIYLPVILK